MTIGDVCAVAAGSTMILYSEVSAADTAASRDKNAAIWAVVDNVIVVDSPVMSSNTSVVHVSLATSAQEILTNVPVALLDELAELPLLDSEELLLSLLELLEESELLLELSELALLDEELSDDAEELLDEPDNS